MKQQTSNSIYKEYLIYRAKNQDKNEYMSFSQFAKAKYNLTMDESKLNEVIIRKEYQDNEIGSRKYKK